jgi:hypothetical protein
MTEMAVGRHEKAVDYVEKGLRIEPSNQRLRHCYEKCTSMIMVDARAFWKEDPTGRPTTAENGHHDGRKVWNERDKYPRASEKDQPPEKEIKPFVLVRAPLDEEWKHMDLADILKEQSILRRAIMGAIEDGDVDEKELEFIMRSMRCVPAARPVCLRAHRSVARPAHACHAHLCSSWVLRCSFALLLCNSVLHSLRFMVCVCCLCRRVNMPKDKQEQVRAALADGDFSEDDVALLHSICPPDPSSDWDSLLKLLEEEQGYLKMIHRFYSMEGSVGKAEGKSMTLVQFGKFIQKMEVLQKGVLDSGQVDRIFLRANMDRTFEGKIEHNKKNVKKETNKGNELVIHEFGAAMIRLSHARFRDLPSLTGRFKTLLEEHVKKCGSQHYYTSLAALWQAWVLVWGG